MAAQIPGVFGAVQPDIFTRVRTRERVNAISGGSRIVCVIGEGESEESLVISALGSGQDGWNSDFSGTSTPTGRHFQISKLDLVAIFLEELIIPLNLELHLKTFFFISIDLLIV